MVNCLFQVSCVVCLHDVICGMCVHLCVRAAPTIMETPGPPPLWEHRGLRRFGNTGASAALGTPGPPPLWSRGLRHFGNAGASAAFGQGAPPLWEHRGLCRFGAGAPPFLGTLGPRRFAPPPPPPPTVAATPESPRSWADQVGIGTPRGGMVQAGAVPLPHIAADTPESPWSSTDRVWIGAPCGGTRRGFRAILRGPAACTIVARVQARSPTNCRGWHGDQHGQRPGQSSGMFWARMSTEGGFAVPRTGTSTMWAVRQGEGSGYGPSPRDPLAKRRPPVVPGRLRAHTCETVSPPPWGGGS